MVSAGFEPITMDIASFGAPSIAEMANEGLLNSAYPSATAFLCLYSDNAARSNMRPENAARFSRALHSSVAKLAAARFGFHPEPHNAF
jgi:hypothetical protein